jgi:nicotinate-nucleotide adenylyltransferase
MARIALFGGSFNPPHVAHQLAALYVLETAPIDELWLVPVFQHPWSDDGAPPAPPPYVKQLAAFEHRFAMCELAFGGLPRCCVSRVEADLGGASRTLHTLEHLHRTRPGDEFVLVIGADLSAERHLWYGADQIERLCSFYVLGRAGYDGPDPALPEVSSSEVRRRLAAGQDVSRLLGRDVAAYIREKGLYR